MVNGWWMSQGGFCELRKTGAGGEWQVFLSGKDLDAPKYQNVCLKLRAGLLWAHVNALSYRGLGRSFCEDAISISGQEN